MKLRRVLLIGTLMMMFVALSGSNQTTATTPTHISPECRAEIIAALETCKADCGRDLRCFIRCVITNIPACLR
jgi:hypothetical protein